MIAPVRVPSTLPQDELGPVNDLTGGGPTTGVPYNTDQWDGYTADRRRRVRATSGTAASTDTVFLTGDIHSGWACDLPYDPSTYPAVGDSAGVELVCSSVTSNNLKDITGTPPRTSSIAVETTIKANNRHVKYLDFDYHGFSVLDVTPAGVQMDWFVIGDRTDRGPGPSWTASCASDSGTQRCAPSTSRWVPACAGRKRSGPPARQPGRRTFLKVARRRRRRGLLLRRAGRPPAALAARRKRCYVLVSTAAGPTRSARPDADRAGACVRRQQLPRGPAPCRSWRPSRTT